ncbi:hypothetical protein RvY_01860 [Ramazzottius varieornatus]|uniref:Uncharacterized protein n=1 Tax=Ramazzottius varieornatus TaxID=947166 RepID=A0A1D1UHU5_RAMVA|nr:hypothetical protein RvY_01860 [Ramazzottius varieornatus]
MPLIKFTGEIGKKLTLLYGNVNGIRSKSEETAMDGGKECGYRRFDESTADCLIADLDQYNLFRKDRQRCLKENGVGVAIAIKNGLQSLRMTSLEVDGLEVYG